MEDNSHHILFNTPQGTIIGVILGVINSISVAFMFLFAKYLTLEYSLSNINYICSFWSSVKAKFRPNWDDYFMNVTHHVADRASCVKIKVGAIIVKNKRIVSTGFNGTPMNLPNCIDGYCPRCHKHNSQGTNLDSCYCTHAEENAIVEVGKDYVL